MAGTIVRTNHLKALWPGVKNWFGKAYDEFPVEWTMLFEQSTDNRAYVEDVGMTGFGLAKVLEETGAVSYDDEKQGFVTRYTHVQYGLGFVISKLAIEDNLYKEVGERGAKGLAFSMRQTKEIIGTAVYNRAFDTSYTGGDGSPLVSATHANVTGGTWSNTPAVAGVLSEGILEQAFIDIADFRTDRGMKISLRPKKLILPPSLEFEATRILKSALRVGVETNDINALKETGKFSDGVAINHYLTDPKAWFIRTTSPQGMKMYERRADEFTTDNDFDTENAKYKATARYSFGWSDPRGMYACPGD